MLAVSRTSPRPTRARAPPSPSSRTSPSSSRRRLRRDHGAFGVGKSTLLHLLGGIDRRRLRAASRSSAQALDAHGAAAIARGSATRGSASSSSSITCCPSSRREENVAFPHRIAGVPAGEARRRAAELLERVGLADRRDHRPRALSGGEQQRVAIARALARGPGLLLADEPTGNLDADSAAAVFELLEELHRERGMTTVLVTHNPELASRCDKIYFDVPGRNLTVAGFPAGM